MADGITIDEVRNVVRDEISPVAGGVSALGDAVGALSDNQTRDAASQVVVIDSSQWEHMAATFRVYATCDVLALLLIAGIFGVVSFSMLVKGWRR